MFIYNSLPYSVLYPAVSIIMDLELSLVISSTRVLFIFNIYCQAVLYFFILTFIVKRFYTQPCGLVQLNSGTLQTVFVELAVHTDITSEQELTWL